MPTIPRIENVAPHGPVGCSEPADWAARRRSVLHAAVGVGTATGAYGLSFGAAATAAGLTLW